jgi:hypothetical protein
VGDIEACEPAAPARGGEEGEEEEEEGAPAEALTYGAKKGGRLDKRVQEHEAGWFQKQARPVPAATGSRGSRDVGNDYACVGGDGEPCCTKDHLSGDHISDDCLTVTKE